MDQMISTREAALQCLRSLPAQAPVGEVLAAAQVQALLHVGDALAAVAGALTLGQKDRWSPAPAGPPWTVHDVVRHREPVDGECYYALLGRPDEAQDGWWHATVLKVDAGTGVLVGQGVRLLEGSDNNSVMQFPP